MSFLFQHFERAPGHKMHVSTKESHITFFITLFSTILNLIGEFYCERAENESARYEF